MKTFNNLKDFSVNVLIFIIGMLFSFGIPFSIFLVFMRITDFEPNLWSTTILSIWFVMCIISTIMAFLPKPIVI